MDFHSLANVDEFVLAVRWCRVLRLAQVFAHGVLGSTRRRRESVRKRRERRRRMRRRGKEKEEEKKMKK